MQRPTKSRTWANEDPAFNGIQTQLAESREESTTLTRQVEDDHQEAREGEPAALDAEPNRSPTSDVRASDEEGLLHLKDGASVKHMSVKQGSIVQAASDDDWLRSRTSRLLGLVDDDDVVASQSNSIIDDPQKMAHPKSSEVSRTGPPSNTSAYSNQGVEKLPNTPSEMADTSRLFMRNIPFSVTENDIWQHFECQGHGPIEEVKISTSLYCYEFFHNTVLMNILIGTNYATHMICTGRVF